MSQTGAIAAARTIKTDVDHRGDVTQVCLASWVSEDFEIDSVSSGGSASE
jgi:hypothetical protein